MSLWDSLSESASNVLDEVQNQTEVAAVDWFRQQISPVRQTASAPPPAPVSASAIPVPQMIQTALTQDKSIIYMILAGVGILAILLFKGK